MADQPATPGVLEALWTVVAAALLGAAKLFRDAMTARSAAAQPEASVASLVERIHLLERSHQEQLNTCTRRMQELEPIVRRVTTVEALVTVIESRLDRLEAAVADLPDRIVDRLRG